MKPGFLFFRVKLSAYSRISLFMILVSFAQSPCLSTTHPVKANGEINSNCTHRPASKICPPNWVKLDDPPLCLYHSYEFRNFSESKQYCHSLGSNVGVVVTFSKDMGVAVMKSIVENGWNNTWISYNDWDGDKKWEWSDRNFVLRDNGYLNFNTPESNPRDRRYRCAIDSTRTKKWSSMNCTHLNSVVCQIETQNGDCEQNWTTLADGYCIKPFREKNVFIHSRRLCNNVNAHLLYIPSRVVGTAFREYINSLHATWIGIQKSQTDNEYVWKWGTGAELSPGNSLWIHQQRSNATNKHCAILTNNGAWDNESCDVELPVTCMRQWAGGPSNTRIELNFHRPDNVFYMGVPMLATCTFIGDDPSKMGWAIVNDSGIFNIEKSAFKISTEILRSDEGFCASRVTSNLVVNDWGLMQSVTLTCFATRLAGHPDCSPPIRALDLCDTAIFSVVAGPTGRPDLQLEYDGKSDVYEVESGGSIIARCTVHTGEDGTLQWMLLSSKNKTTFLDDADKRVVSYIRNESKQEIQSELRLPLQISQSGTTISCFGYDAIKFNSGTPCRDEDRFCSKSKQIKVYQKENKPDKGIYKWLKNPVTPVFILGVIIMWTIACAAAKKLASQLGGEAKPLPQNDDRGTIRVSHLPVQDASDKVNLWYMSLGERGSVSTSVDIKSGFTPTSVGIKSDFTSPSKKCDATVTSAENQESLWPFLSFF